MSSRLISAPWRTLCAGVGRWPLPARTVLGPRPLSVGCVDCATRQEPSGKKVLSEKKLVRLLTGRDWPAAPPQEAAFCVLLTWSSCVPITLLTGHRDTDPRQDGTKACVPQVLGIVETPAAQGSAGGDKDAAPLSLCVPACGTGVLDCV